MANPVLDPILSTTQWSEFELVMIQTCREITLKLKSTFSSFDIIPSRFVKQIFDTIGSDLVIIINNCLKTGTAPEYFKVASVTPICKKPSLDTADYSNFRPISNLLFVSKILEKIVFRQLQSYLSTNCISDIFQSGFKSLHSTESALLKVFNDVLTSTDSGNTMALVLLDLSSAFDFVDHGILLSRLDHCIGIRGTVLDWFRSFLSNRRFSVSIGQYSSSVAHSSCGVPQGSTLAPLLFSLYMLPIGSIFRKFDVSYHCYADDTQLYIPIKRNDKSALYQLTACLQELKSWLTNNFLHLNDDKTQIILFRPNEKTNLSTVDLGSLSPYYSSEVKDLGFILDRAGRYIACDSHAHLVSKAGSLISAKSPSPVFKWSSI